jgi:hypothetical protein
LSSDTMKTGEFTWTSERRRKREPGIGKRKAGGILVI